MIPFIKWDLKSFIIKGNALKLKSTKHKSKYLTQKTSYLTKSPSPKMNDKVINPIVMADKEEIKSGDNIRLISPSPTEIKSKLEDLM